MENWWKRMHSDLKIKTTPSPLFYTPISLRSSHNREMNLSCRELINGESRSKLNDKSGWHFKENMQVLMIAETFSLQTPAHTHNTFFHNYSTISGVPCRAIINFPDWTKEDDSAAGCGKWKNGCWTVLSFNYPGIKKTGSNENRCFLVILCHLVQYSRLPATA